MARIVAAGVPHHVTQRGNRRQKVFFSDSDYECYRAMLAEGCRKAGVDVLGYCLMCLLAKRKPGSNSAAKAKSGSDVIIRIVNCSVPVISVPRNSQGRVELRSMLAAWFGRYSEIDENT